MDSKINNKPSEQNSLLKLSDIFYKYNKEQVILDKLSFSLQNNEKIGICGNTGCGKTTLLYIIMGLIKPDKGDIFIFGNKIADINQYAKIRPRIGFLFQNSDDQLFSPSVIDDIAFGPLNLGKPKHDL